MCSLLLVALHLIIICSENPRTVTQQTGEGLVQAVCLLVARTTSCVHSGKRASSSKIYEDGPGWGADLCSLQPLLQNADKESQGAK